MGYTTINGKLVNRKAPRQAKYELQAEKKMSLMKILDIGGDPYCLYHCNEDDARYLKDSDDDLVLVFDANLNVNARDGRFGTLENEGNWILYYGPIRTRLDTEVEASDYCWNALEAAEIEVCKFYIQNTKLPKFKRVEETEGGSCD